MTKICTLQYNKLTNRELYNACYQLHRKYLRSRADLKCKGYYTPVLDECLPMPHIGERDKLIEHYEALRALFNSGLCNIEGVKLQFHKFISDLHFGPLLKDCGVDGMPLPLLNILMYEPYSLLLKCEPTKKYRSLWSFCDDVLLTSTTPEARLHEYCEYINSKIDVFLGRWKSLGP